MSHPEQAARFTADRERAAWHDRALWSVRARRDAAARSVPEWEALREQAAAIKARTLADLASHLEAFERHAVARGAVVHWAADAAAHNRIVLEILRSRGAARVVKSKSMLTEECGLNHHLERNGVEVVDTDLGERIVQLRGEPPSHIVLPAIHLRKEEIGDLFHAHLGTPPGMSDPALLTAAARRHLREKFLAADACITGVNFAVAESGGLVICTNEGNADLGMALPRLHIACMGIEKIVPRAADLAVFTRLLARSATGQPITAYTSHVHGPRPGGELHVVIVDGGRSQMLERGEHAAALACIRCGACLNTCPVYRRSGGHSYEAVIPGPIGSILAPAADPGRHRSLPYACTMCGSCNDVCPVKIDLRGQLLRLRAELVTAGHLPGRRRASRIASLLLRSPTLYALTGRLARRVGRLLPGLADRIARPWTESRALPDLPEKSFRQQLSASEEGRSSGGPR